MEYPLQDMLELQGFSKKLHISLISLMVMVFLQSITAWTCNYSVDFVWSGQVSYNFCLHLKSCLLVLHFCSSLCEKMVVVLQYSLGAVLFFFLLFLIFGRGTLDIMLTYKVGLGLGFGIPLVMASSSSCQLLTIPPIFEEAQYCFLRIIYCVSRANHGFRLYQTVSVF